MLVLTRKMGQKIIIDGGAIQIVVLKNTGDMNNIGILAPKHMNVDREEIYLKKRRQEREEAFLAGVAL